MASTEEKLLTLLLSVEHLQHTAMEQQKAVADSLAVARKHFADIGIFLTVWQNRSGMKSETRCRSWMLQG